MTKPLSLAAQAVLDAVHSGKSATDRYNILYRWVASAALRAAAKSLQSDPSSSSPLGALLACQDQLCAIAAELEGIVE